MSCNLHSAPAAQPFAQSPTWAANLQAVAARGLELCPDLPRMAARFEAFWAHELLDRPIFIAETSTNPRRPITKRTDLLHQPERWLAAKQQDLLDTHWVGDAIPNVRVDFGPVLLGGLLGGRMHFTPDTSWTEVFIDDQWSNFHPRLDKNNELWQLLLVLTRLVCDDARGRYLVRTPDLGGSGDVLLNLRGSEAICLDCLEQPEMVDQAVRDIYPVWRQAFGELYDIATQAGAGIFHWLEVWSNRPYMIPACDLNYLIGPREFGKLFLPDIARQVATVGRGIFHLDGPGATRHIDALLQVPGLEAIQFVPGSGAPSVLPWIDMFRKIQAKGRSLLVACPPQEVLPLVRAVSPGGLAIMTGGLPPKELDALFDELCRLFR